MKGEKVLAVIQLDEEIHHWISGLALAKRGDTFDLSTPINQLLHMAKNTGQTFDEIFPQKQSSEMGPSTEKYLKTLLQTTAESLMILRHQFLPNREDQVKLTQAIQKKLAQQFCEKSSKAEPTES